MPETLLSVRGAVKVFGPAGRKAGEGTVALDEISFDLAAGSTLGIVGESGSGKSTLGRAVAALEFLDSGTVTFDGVDITSLRGQALRRARRGFQVVFQDPFSSLDRRMRIGDTLTEPLVIHGIGTGESQRAAVLQMLERVGLQRSVANAYPHELSGGQRQRVAICRALMVSPKLIVADEPTSSLDVSIQAHVLNLMRDLQTERALSYVFVSHDLSVVRYMSDRIGVMHRGRVVELGSAGGVYTAPLHPYTRELLDATDGKAVLAATPVELDVRGRQGCLYRARCPFADDTCASQTPVLRTLSSDRAVACHHPLPQSDGTGTATSEVQP
jgi:oligopeptide/dipeptide ABC transporter ATP-binding protein